MFVYPLAQAVTLHGKQNHPIILVDNSNQPWVVDLELKPSKQVEVELLKDAVGTTLIEILAANTFSDRIPWIIKLPFTIRYTVKTEQTYKGAASQRVLVRDLLTRRLCPCDNTSHQFITSPVLVTIVEREKLDREAISKTMTLALGDEIDFIADTIGVKGMFIMDNVSRAETITGNPYVVLEDSIEEDLLGTTYNNVAERVQCLRYLLDGSNKTRLKLDDLIKTHQPPLNSEGYLDLELNLQDTNVHSGFVPRVRETLVVHKGEYLPVKVFNALPQEERKKPYYFIVLDTRLSHYTFNPVRRDSYVDLQQRYPQLYVTCYYSDEGKSPKHRTLNEVLENNPLPEQSLPEFVVDEKDFTEAMSVFKLTSYLEAHQPAVATHLRMNDILTIIKPLI